MATQTTTTAPSTHQSIHLTSDPDSSAINAGDPVPRGPVDAKLNFYVAPTDGTKPYNYTYEPTNGEPQRNYSNEELDVTIHDVRGREKDFTLDNNAFAVLQGISSEENDFNDDDQIKRVYYPEVEKVILDNVPGSNRVLIFDHTIRRPQPESDTARGPVMRAHIDQTQWAAAERVRHHLPDEAETLLKSRYRIINVWRPLNGPVLSFPLAVADGATVDSSEIVPIDHRYPERTGEVAGVKYSAQQKWYYWSGMKNTERLLLKCADSDERVGKWGRVPHSAFEHPRTPEGAPGRESIEVRALVFG